MAIKLGLNSLYMFFQFNYYYHYSTTWYNSFCNNWKHVSKVATVILYVAQVIIVVLRLILYFVLMMGAVQYFLKRGEKLNKTFR